MSTGTVGASPTAYRASRVVNVVASVASPIALIGPSIATMLTLALLMFGTEALRDHFETR